MKTQLKQKRKCMERILVVNILFYSQDHILWIVIEKETLFQNLRDQLVQIGLVLTTGPVSSSYPVWVGSLQEYGSFYQGSPPGRRGEEDISSETILTRQSNVFYNFLKVYFKETLINVDLDAFNLSYFNAVLFKSTRNFNCMINFIFQLKRLFETWIMEKSYIFFI